MRSTKLAKRLTRLVPVIAVIVFVLAGARPVEASFECFQRLKECYINAARQVDWFTMWLAGLDCELDFTDCVRRAIIGR